MKNTLIKKLEAWRPCQDAVAWLGDQTLEEAFSTCQRADWMLWAYANLYPDNVRELTLAKGHCVNLIRDLLVDERSIKAIDAAIGFGEGEIYKSELDAARAAADAAVYSVYASAAAARAGAARAARAARAASARAASADAAADAASARAASADAARAASADAAQKQSLAEMADICRRYLTIAK